MVVKKNGGHFTRFKSIKELQLELGEIITKNMAKTATRQPGGPHLLFHIWRVFVELDKPKRALLKMNLTSMPVSMF